MSTTAEPLPPPAATRAAAGLELPALLRGDVPVLAAWLKQPDLVRLLGLNLPLP